MTSDEPGELGSGTDAIAAPWARFGELMGTPVTELERDVARARLRSELFDEPKQATTLGRYVLLDRRGAGAMGVVYAAYDPELGRKVAIKVMSPRGREGTGEHRQRLLREAQALAKLGHPNVVAVHDAGTIAGDADKPTTVFIAMEYVQGPTLTRWLAQAERGWREVLAVMIQAARGLAAVHAAGLVHRDLKPDNIMVADDGRVRVMDFGLARAEDVVRSSERAIVESSGASKPLALHEELTVDGALVGTPAYMAPEHLAGLRNDAKSDQFSFCVAFWEALHGQRPFAGSSLPELAANILDGHVREPVDPQRAPAWLRSIVVRGMATDPLQRWPSMAELVQALERGDARARRRIAVLGLGALAVVVAGAFAWRAFDRRARIAACADEGAAIAEVWNDETRAQIRGAMIGTGVGNAEVTADKALPWIDERVASWQTARTEVCTAANVHGTLDGDGLDRARWCFDERRMQLEALVAEWRAPSTATIQLAVEAASGLPDATTCSDAALLARLPLPPADTRAAIQSVQAELAHAAALELAGDFEGGRRIAEPALARADASSWPPLAAAAHQRMGALLDELGHYADAERELATAYFDATRAGAIGVAADAAIKQIYVVGHRLARHDDALLWSRMATLAVDQLGDDAPRKAMLAAYTALVHDAAGEHERALELYQEALALRELAYGSEHPAVPATLTMIAGVYYSTGRFTEAEPLYQRGLAELEAAYGPDHPNVARSLAYLGGLALAQHDPHTAKPLYERALVIFERSVGPDHADCAAMHGGLGSVHLMLHEDEEARRSYERSIAIWERALGPEHPDLAVALDNLGIAYSIEGDYEKAESLQRRALAIIEKAHGPQHRRAAAFAAALARTLLARHRWAEAAQQSERALAILEPLGAPIAELSQLRLTLAESLWELDRDRDRALALATTARDGYEQTADVGGYTHAVEWLAEHTQ